MQINYIILAHNAPDQLARLIDRLRTVNTQFYIHIDANHDISHFLYLEDNANGVCLLKNNQRVATHWGSYGLVQATLNAIEQIIEDNRKGYCVLLSRQDYPIKSNRQINELFETDYGVNFIQGYKISDTDPKELRDRLSLYKFDSSKKRFDYKLIAPVWSKEFFSYRNRNGLLYILMNNGIVALSRVLSKIIRKRKHPPYLNAYKGSQWWALPIETIQFIYFFVKNHPDYVQFHKFTLIPDEVFFHSIIFSFFDIKKIKPEITYANWENNASSPEILVEKDFATLKQLGSDKLFARKFDTAVDTRILELIDQHLLDDSLV